MSTMPTRIDGDLFEAAKAAGALHSRSAAQQLDYWIRLGRELETASGTTVNTLGQVLLGKASYDDLDERTQATARVAWDEELDAKLAALDLREDLDATGEPWFEAGADGDVVERGAHHSAV